MGNHSNTVSTGIELLCTFGIMIFVGLLLDLGTLKCSKPGCDNDAKEGSSYCWLHDHDTYRYSSGKSTYGSGSSTSSTKSSSSASGSSKDSGSVASSGITAKSSTTGTSSKKTYSSGSSSSKKNHSSMDSYDDGYNAVYEDDDYDEDRYRTDDDYAAGVDDAMEDEDEDW